MPQGSWCATNVERGLDVHANAHEASHFLLIPQAVVVAGNADCCAPAPLRGCRSSPARAATSLSGQALTAGILVDVRRSFKSIEVLDHGACVRVQPGVTVRALNARLAPNSRKLGPGSRRA